MEALEWTIFNIRLIISSMWTPIVYFRQIRFSIRCHETIIVIFNEHLIIKSNKIFFFLQIINIECKTSKLVLTWYMYFFFNIQNVKKNYDLSNNALWAVSLDWHSSFGRLLEMHNISIVNIKKRKKIIFDQNHDHAS